MTAERLEKLCRQTCEKLGLDPDTIMTSRLDVVSDVKVPRWQTYAGKITELHTNKVIFDILTKESDASVSS
jgi:hypothetical protein